jgi:hypothetical protein
MRRGVLLHIGLHKTGTTSIQYYLRDHEALLAEHGVRFPRGWLRLNNHFELPLAVMRPERMFSARTRGDEWRDPGFRAELLNQVSRDLRTHRSMFTVLSAEDLSLLRYDDELAVVRQVIGDARVVVYLRRPAAFLASMSAHLSKPGQPGVSDDPDAYNYLHRDSWRLDYDKLVALWRRHFTRVSAVGYDQVTQRDSSVLPSFLAKLGVEVTPDALGYWLNRRADAVPRAEGNRAHGLGFGVVGERVAQP